jgi:hypothetical protein
LEGERGGGEKKMKEIGSNVFFLLSFLNFWNLGDSTLKLFVAVIVAVS